MADTVAEFPDTTMCSQATLLMTEIVWIEALLTLMLTTCDEPVETPAAPVRLTCTVDSEKSAVLVLVLAPVQLKAGAAGVPPSPLLRETRKDHPMSCGALRTDDKSSATQGGP